MFLFAKRHYLTMPLKLDWLSLKVGHKQLTTNDDQIIVFGHNALLLKSNPGKSDQIHSTSCLDIGSN